MKLRYVTRGILRVLQIGTPVLKEVTDESGNTWLDYEYLWTDVPLEVE